MWYAVKFSPPSFENENTRLLSISIRILHTLVPFENLIPSGFAIAANPRAMLAVCIFPYLGKSPNSDVGVLEDITFSIQKEDIKILDYLIF